VGLKWVEKAPKRANDGARPKLMAGQILGRHGRHIPLHRSKRLAHNYQGRHGHEDKEDECTVVEIFTIDKSAGSCIDPRKQESKHSSNNEWEACPTNRRYTQGTDAACLSTNIVRKVHPGSCQGCIRPWNVVLPYRDLVKYPTASLTGPRFTSPRALSG